jgi:hypothetical protein
MLGGAFCHQACGRCPPENYLGDAESRQLHNTAERELIVRKWFVLAPGTQG